ncbi:antirestriction protein [Teredinibacter turnerae]|uniref:antirestriction protein n=1 Tax=Teredinibacter turnerae TaxID=2426 RepID=UPI00036975DE|nr:antirestriction protein [Teredinibacter turnerae]
MTITRKMISEKYRGKILPRFIGNPYLLFEQSIYGYTSHFVEGYQGGFWEFYELSNGGFYMSFASDKTFTFSNPDNYFSETMDADTISIIINLYVFNHLAFKYSGKNDSHSMKFMQLYTNLYDYTKTHPEATLIMRAID